MAMEIANIVRQSGAKGEKYEVGRLGLTLDRSKEWAVDSLGLIFTDD